MSSDIKNPRVRIAPSPTGFLHIGTARTALFNYLFAKKYNGKFILRVEDTDLERSDKQYEKDIFNGLDWLDIVPDESPVVGGPYAPYRQSERIANYKPYLEKLLNERKAFYCFHSEQELEDEKKKQIATKDVVRHFCSDWRDFSQEEAEKKRKTTKTSIIRFKIPTNPSNHQIAFNDVIRDQVHFFTSLLGDFSIAKSLETPLYNFAVVIDDHEMAITHVIRGEDHISNTPKQILLQQALGFPQPHYAHLPLILGPDRSKLSKRHGATSVNEYKEQGYLPEALVNFMTLLGWNPGTDQEIFSKEELEKIFSIEQVQKSGAVFDTQKLDWMNGEYIRAMKPEELLERVKNFLPKESLQYPEAYMRKVIELEQPRLKKLSEIRERVGFFFKEPEYDKELLRWKNMPDEDIKNSLLKAKKVLVNIKEPIDKKALENAFFSEIGDSDKGILLWPLRVALSGKKASPGPFEILEILGIPESTKRLKQAEQKIQ